MRISLEPTQDQSGHKPNCQQHRVALEHPSDDLDIHEVGELLRWAVMAYGFHPKIVKDVLGE